ncbi:metabotropic glutamate receptor 2-like [Diadema antillarum]|uniref:metabotropic glutamate receptor 2-like n=1 Tax=Diadema antillarum TaxID=105358 RepID=UPI003A88EFE1
MARQLSSNIKLVICSLLIFFQSAMSSHVPYSDVVYRMDGDIYFGGLFPIHEVGPSGDRCGNLREAETLHRVEAMVFAINEINNRTDILPNVTLGFEIRDTCSDISVTQLGALKFLPSDFFRQSTCPATTDPNYSTNERPIIGVIGTEMSSTTMAAAELLGLNHLPVVSYFATSNDLSDEVQYPYFLRVVPPDRLQVQAMLAIIEKYKWSYINVVYSDDSYGLSAFQEITRGVATIGVCLAASYEIGGSLSEADFDQIIQDMQLKPRAKVLILFIQVEHANSFLSAMRRNSLTGEYQILGSDGWGMSIGEIDPLNRRVALGALKTHLFSAAVPEFEEYFMSLTSDHKAKNPWYEAYIESVRNCSYVKQGAACLSTPGFSVSSAVSLVIDSVYTMALGLSDMHHTLCEGQSGVCTALKPFDTQVLFEFMKNISFDGRSGNMVFDEGGDAVGRYFIENIQMVDANYELIRVGTWTALHGDNLTMNGSAVVWGIGENTRGGSVPQSYCSDPCQWGEIEIPWENDCCWTCLRCSDDEITTQNRTCMKCGDKAYPDENQVTCLPISALYMMWASPWAIMLIVSALLGLIFCSLVTYFYVQNRQNMLIKASSRELCYIMLVGIYMSYILVFAFIAKPSKASCAICRMMLILSFTVIYAPLLTRINRIYRIFDRARRSVRRPRFISPHSQVTIAFMVILLQVLMNTIWLILIPPSAIEVVIAPGKVELTCNIQSGELIASLCYNLILLILCSYFAFVTRNVPNNYNESRFISLCVYTVLVIWIGFISSYFVVPESHLKVTVLSLAMIFNGTITLCFMFLSKLYAIYFSKDVIISTNTYSGGGQASQATSTTGHESRLNSKYKRSAHLVVSRFHLLVVKAVSCVTRSTFSILFRKRTEIF